MLFCPTCANLLVISAETGLNKWACNTCAYEFPITKQVWIAFFLFLIISVHFSLRSRYISGDAGVHGGAVNVNGDVVGVPMLIPMLILDTLPPTLTLNGVLVFVFVFVPASLFADAEAEDAGVRGGVSGVCGCEGRSLSLSRSGVVCACDCVWDWTCV